MPAESEAFSLAPGEILVGRYEIENGLGKGAMGEVYAARDLELREAIAIKLLRPEIARNERVLERFKREIQLARRVTHANVCRVFDLVLEAEPRRVFLTMERLSGPTLADHLEAVGRLPLAAAIAILAEVAAGLDAAHLAGIVHRDLKTANVILVPAALAGGQPRVVLTDFGVAWSEAYGGGEGGDHLTASGQVVGSPAYMAPEQLRGQSVSPQTDIYALGVMGYELITGRLPFEGETAFITALKRIQEAPIPPERWVEDLPAAVSAALLRALAVTPADRFASASEMIAALAGRAALPPSPPAAARRSRWRAAWPLALIGGLVAVAYFLLAERRLPDIGWLPARPPAQREARLLFANGLAALSHDDLAAAKAFFEGALGKEPGQPAIAFALGEAWERLGHLGKAREAIALACRDSAAWPNAEARRCEARQAELAGDWPAAIAVYSALVAVAPGDFDLALRLAAVEIRGGQTDAAGKLLASWRQRPLGELEALRLDLVAAELAGAKTDFKSQQELAAAALASATRLQLAGLRARALFEAGSGALGAGAFAAASEQLAEAASLATELGDLRRRADASRKLGVIEDRLGRRSAAEARYREAETSYREIGDRLGEAKVGNDLCAVFDKLRRYRESEAACSRALALMRQVGFPRGEAVVLLNSGVPAFHQGELALAKERFAAALPRLLAVGDRQSAETAEHNLANIAGLEGRLEAAQAALLLLAERHQKEGRANELTSQIFADLAEVELARGRRSEAASWAQRALELRLQLGERIGVVESRLFLAAQARAPAAALAALEPEVSELAAAQPALALLADTRLARALLDAGQPEQAREPLARALAVVRELPCPPWEALPAQYLAPRLEASAAALAAAEAGIAEARQRGLVQLELLGRLELALARRQRAELAAVAGAARERGLLELAERAEAQARRL